MKYKVDDEGYMVSEDGRRIASTVSPKTRKFFEEVNKGFVEATPENLKKFYRNELLDGLVYKEIDNVN